MIHYLTGKVIGRGENFAVIDNNGIGFKVFLTSENINNLPATDSAVKIFCYLYIREETGPELYGFLKEEELELFELLISISGVGPKAALGVLSVGDVPSIKKAIVEGRSDLLMGVSGVGRKMADRIVLELKNKIEASGDIILSKALAPEDEDAVQALVNLGYKKLEASEAIKKASPELEAGQKVKEALRFLGK